MIQYKPNWIAFGCAICFILCYLLLPFYSIVMVPVNGLRLIQFFSALMVLPLLAGVAMAIASLVLNSKVGIGIWAITFGITLILMFAGNTILFSGNQLTILVNNVLGSAGTILTSAIHVAPGIGCLFCLLLCVAGIVAIIVSIGQKTPLIKPEDDFYS